uniref:Uncharacterized protein n=1 Tax=Corvus moneduloides TaxID=1196302 RepID=A0A8C3ECB8_CORMO
MLPTPAAGICCGGDKGALPECEQRITKVSLAELLRCFEHPISEEQAWAICFQCCRKIEQLAQGLVLKAVYQCLYRCLSPLTLIFPFQMLAAFSSQRTR